MAPGMRLGGFRQGKPCFPGSPCPIDAVREVSQLNSKGTTLGPRRKLAIGKGGRRGFFESPNSHIFANTWPIRVILESLERFQDEIQGF